MYTLWTASSIFLVIFTLICFYITFYLDSKQSLLLLDELKNEPSNLKMEMNQHGQDIRQLKKVIQPRQSRPIGGSVINKFLTVEKQGEAAAKEITAMMMTKKMTNSATKSQNRFCQINNNYSRYEADIQMLDILKMLSFDNTNGGAWRQGWEIKYHPAKVAMEKKLRVIVVPHSHTDPGWLITFEEYFKEQTKHILTGMARHLDQKENMHFIYAEMSFFEMWWREQDEQTKEKVKKYLEEGLLEIVTGGWVMADEANSHYFSIITELFEGHEWLKNELGYRPTSHWSIDPFGLSPSLPMLMTAANITNAVIQRTHYSIKKHLARNKQLEFMWRQMWGRHGDEKDMRTHLMPFYSYDVPHTCGPDPAICCQFDFKRLLDGPSSCPWGYPPKEIDERNVAERAFKLYDQYRKKSQLYETNVLLVPLGDDFRYQTDLEWTKQYNNYDKLFRYMNNQTQWNVKARFGTLKDYFDLLDMELKAMGKKLPMLTGDFFTYADRDDHYWSGYFTSRPFYKQMDRVLHHNLRSADIAFSLAAMDGFQNDQIFTSLVKARRWHSLFQHHDGVTGTARENVMVDYGNKMLSALTWCEEVLSASLGYLLGGKLDLLKMEEIRKKQDLLPERRVYSRGSTVVLFNTLARTRKEPICIHVDYRKSRIDREIPQEIFPVFRLKNERLELVEELFELCFVYSIGPLAVDTLQLVDGEAEQATVESNLQFNLSMSGFTMLPFDEDIILSNDLVEVKFNRTSGFIQKMRVAGGTAVDINLNFVHYGTRSHKRLSSGGTDSLSGAYLFLPDGPAHPLPIKQHHIVALKGQLLSRILVVGHHDIGLLQTISLFKGSTALEIETKVYLQKMSNYELAMRLSSSIQSGDDIYTDLNGLQLIRRTRMLKKLPLQAHFYPMPTSAYLEDSRARLSLLGAQPLGVASLESGQLEVMLDRRLEQDDDRGLLQNVEDNKWTVSRFRLLVEPLNGPLPEAQVRVGFHTMTALMTSQDVNYPVVKMIASRPLPVESVPGLSANFPYDYHIVNLRTLTKKSASSHEIFSPQRETALILHHSITDCRGQNHKEKEDIILFPKVKTVHLGSLTLLYENTSVLVEELSVKPQQVRTFKLLW